MGSTPFHKGAAEAALDEAHRNPVLSAEQWIRAAEVHALLAIEARLAQLVDRVHLRATDGCPAAT
jgi:hypothetical protein